MGQIITFYSYKGGVGRTMALANVAVLLSKWGYKVLMVDWDLEAPGLEFYFKDYLDLEAVAQQEGIVDLMLGNISEKPKNWQDLLTSIKLSDSHEPLLHFLTAGKRSEDYFSRLKQLDLKEFYKQKGGFFIERLRDKWKETYDYVLLDSRTGITDIGGVCTIQLPDILILLFTANEQNLKGVIDVGQKAYRARQEKLPFDRLSLISIPIPSKFDSTDEFEISQQWLNRFSSELPEIYANWLPTSVERRKFLEITKIPYISYFSFGEKLAVLKQDTIDPGGMGYAYETLAALIANNLESVEQLLDRRDEFVRRASKIHNRRHDSPLMSPRDLQQFTGREEELLQLERMLLDKDGAAVKVCCVAGVGGVGKTALAAHFANVYRDRFPDGVFWARVDSETPMEVARNIAKALHQEIGVLQDETHAHTAIQRLLLDRCALLVLDNADGKHATESVRYMEPSGMTVAVLITTRNRELSSELGADNLDLGSFRLEEGITLFEKVLRDDLRLKTGREDAYRIVELLGGLPLAVDLAAQNLARQREISFAQYLEELQIEELKAGRKSIIATLSKSMELLKPFEQTAFIALGACVETGFSIETAMAVAGIRDRDDMRKLLNDTLRDLSMVQVPLRDRFALHPVVRAFVRAQEGIAQADRRHAQYWHSYVKEHSRDSVNEWDSIASEWDGIRIAWDWCLDVLRQGLAQENSVIQNAQDCYLWGAEIAASLRYFLVGYGLWEEAIKRMPDALEAAKQIEDRELEFTLRRHLAIILRKTGNYDEAIQHHKTNIELADRMNRRDWKGMERQQLGRICVRQERYNEAEKLYQESLDIARSRGPDGTREQVYTLNCLGELHRCQENLDKATDYFRQALQLYEELKDGQGICSTLGHLGDAYANMGSYENAMWYYASAMSMFDRSGRLEVKGSLCQNLGFVLQSLQRDVDALACYIVSADICDRLGISGWGGKSPADARNSLLKSLGPEADNFRITSGNTAEESLNRAHSRVQEIVEFILATGESPDGKGAV